MPSVDSWYAASAMFPVDLYARAAVAPAILLAILVVHGAYFFLNRGRNGQQAIALDDLTSLGHLRSGRVNDFTVVNADRKEFDAATRTTSEALFALPPYAVPASTRGPYRFNEARRFVDVQVRHTLICGDDVELAGRTIFFHPLKVAGDLLIEGHAIFLQPVIINGVLKVRGQAHFAAGVISKGDAMIRGSIAIGSDSQPSWAVVRELALEQRLKLNGTIIAARAVELKRAA